MRRFQLLPGLARFETGIEGGLLSLVEGQTLATEDAHEIHALTDAPHAIQEVDAKGKPVGEPFDNVAGRARDAAAVLVAQKRAGLVSR